MRAAARPLATIVIGAATAACYLLVSAGDWQAQADAIGGFIPARVSDLALSGAMPVGLTPLTATLLHGGLLHLGFNLLLLGYCGQQVEVPLGRWGLAILYGVGAYAAAAVQFLVTPHSPVPMIGASGAISALVGAYALLYGQRRPSALHPELARWLHVLWLAAAWIALQALIGFASRTVSIAVATPAHVGGFLAGLLLARPLLRWRYRKA